MVPVGTKTLNQKAVFSLAVSDTVASSTLITAISSTANRTLTSTPTIAHGLDGQLLLIISDGAAGSGTITMQDQGTLAGSNLRLDATAGTLNIRDNWLLMFNAAIGDWVLLSSKNII